MAIRNKEDAEKYLNEVREILQELSLLSAEAGVDNHTAMWQSIEGIFWHSSRAIDNLVSAVMIQNHLLLTEIHDEPGGEVEDDDF